MANAQATCSTMQARRTGTNGQDARLEAPTGAGAFRRLADNRSRTDTTRHSTRRACWSSPSCEIPWTADPAGRRTASCCGSGAWSRCLPRDPVMEHEERSPEERERVVGRQLAFHDADVEPLTEPADGERRQAPALGVHERQVVAGVAQVAGARQHEPA